MSQKMMKYSRAFDLLNLIDMKQVIQKNTLIDDDGTIYFNLRSSALLSRNSLVPNRSYCAFCDAVFSDLPESRKLIDRELCYIAFNPQEEMKLTGFAVIKDGRIYRSSQECIIHALEQIKKTDSHKFSCFRKRLEAFSDEAELWLRLKIRDTLFDSTDVLGFFKKDYLKNGTYFQNRQKDTDDIFYVMYRWWDKLNDDHIIWVDTSEERNQKIFIALNE